MKDLIKILGILLVAFWINACGDSRDLHESQMLDAKDLQVESRVDSSVDSDVNPRDLSESTQKFAYALSPNPNDLQNATFAEKSNVGFSATFIGDDIAKYSGALYGDNTFWGKIFVKNLKDCDDIKNADVYVIFSEAKDRIMKLKHPNYPIEHIYKISFMSVHWHNDGVMVNFRAIESQNYRGNDLKYYQTRYPFGNFDYDRYQDLSSGKDSFYTSFTEDNDEDSHPFEVFICPTNK